MILKVDLKGVTSYAYALQPVTNQITQLSGYSAGISLSNKPKKNVVFLVKKEGVFGQKEKDLPKILCASPQFSELCKQYGERFRELFLEP